MESGRAPLASMTPIPRGQFARPEAWRRGGRVPAAETATGFIRKEIRLAGLIHSRSRSVAGSNWLGKEYRTPTAKLLNKQPCRYHHAGAFVRPETPTDA